MADEQQFYVHDGALWNISAAGGVGGISATLNASAHGAQTDFELIEEEIVLSGAFVDSAIVIPDRAIVFAVSTRTTQAVTGASSYDCGITGDIGKYGASLGVALGSTNSGVTGPSAFYADMLDLSSSGGDIVIDGPNGKLSLQVSPTITAQVRKTSRYELEMTTSAGDVYRVISGSISPIEEIAL